ncbi:hypothetical protein [Krasilnikovia sp. M28-CT-15]|uniref:hypothetical protein n=1 Tax=Krasilnikovia sp. M28-CT-15 TaxID=3373540 RepID=UPI00399C8A1C
MLRRIVLITVLLAPLAACGHAGGGAAGPAATAGVGAADPTTAPPVTASAANGSPAGAPGPASTSGSTGASPSAGAPTATLSGTQHAFIKAADPAQHTITFDLVDWFEGKKAAAACKQDGVTETANDWCVGYYYRNNSSRLRTLPVKAGAKLRVVDMTPEMHLADADLATFRKSLESTRHLFVFDVTAGEITKADEVYTP